MGEVSVLGANVSSYAITVGAALILALSGCQNSKEGRDTSLNIPVPEAISARKAEAKINISARIEIPRLGISTPLNIDNDRATGAWPELPPGRYTIYIIFETDLPGFGTTVLAEASRDMDITHGSNIMTFYMSDYRYPDDDEDKFNNLVEVSFGTDPHNGGSMPQPARVFLTSVNGTANLSGWPDAGGKIGMAAGDAICQARAEAAGLQGRFVAWLSDRNHDAYCRMHGLNGRIADDCGQEKLPENAGPWVRTDGYPFAPGIADMIWNATIYTPLVFVESGQLFYKSSAAEKFSLYIWSGTDETGGWAENMWVYGSEGLTWGEGGDCDGWNSDSTDSPAVAKGMVLDSTQGWTFDMGGGSCDEIAALACFEIDKNAPLPDLVEPGKVVFVTSVFGAGDLSKWPESGGKTGLMAGDAICRARAAFAGLSNADTFKVYLGDDTTIAVDRLISNGPWVRVDGVPVAKNREELTIKMGKDGYEGGTFSSISVDEKGSPVDIVDKMVWVGVDWTGQSTSYNCLNWTSSDEEQHGTAAFASMSNLLWLPPGKEAGRVQCKFALRLYCFEDE